MLPFFFVLGQLFLSGLHLNKKFAMQRTGGVREVFFVEAMTSCPRSPQGQSVDPRPQDGTLGGNDRCSCVSSTLGDAQRRSRPSDEGWWGSRWLKGGTESRLCRILPVEGLDGGQSHGASRTSSPRSACYRCREARQWVEDKGCSDVGLESSPLGRLDATVTGPRPRSKSWPHSHRIYRLGASSRPDPGHAATSILIHVSLFFHAFFYDPFFAARLTSMNESNVFFNNSSVVLLK